MGGYAGRRAPKLWTKERNQRKSGEIWKKQTMDSPRRQNHGQFFTTEGETPSSPLLFLSHQIIDPPPTFPPLPPLITRRCIPSYFLLPTLSFFFSPFLPSILQLQGNCAKCIDKNTRTISFPSVHSLLGLPSISLHW